MLFLVSGQIREMKYDSENYGERFQSLKIILADREESAIQKFYEFWDGESEPYVISYHVYDVVADKAIV